MKKITHAMVASAFGTLLLAHPAMGAAGAIVGEPAPAFSLPDTNGGQEALSALKGKYVVLECVNFECPFVGKHYGSGNMQKLQKIYTGKGVVWLSINSSAPGKQGALDATKANALVKDKGAAPTAFLLDSEGAVGQAYGAKTTPHMFIIDPSGKLIYNGAIDDRPSTDKADIGPARNYVQAALDEALAGKPVTTTSSQPYGCSVKYR